MLDLRRLRILHAVAQHGSLRAAADALSYTRAAVSQQIAALEREIDAPVLERHARGARLTDVGRALVGHTEAIMARLAEAEAEVDAIADLRGGRVRLGSFATATGALLPQALALFRARHPEVELTLVAGEPDQLLPRLRRRDLDCTVIFRSDADRSPEPGVELRPLLEDPMVVALPEGHPLARRPALRLADLRDEPWIQGPHGYCFEILRAACHEAGFEPRVPFECDAFDAGQPLVGAGLGIALVPWMAVRGQPPGVVWRGLGPETPIRHVYAAVLTDGFRSPATEAMCQTLADVADTYQAEIAA